MGVPILRDGVSFGSIAPACASWHNRQRTFSIGLNKIEGEADDDSFALCSCHSRRVQDGCAVLVPDMMGAPPASERSSQHGYLDPSVAANPARPWFSEMSF